MTKLKNTTTKINLYKELSPFIPIEHQHLLQSAYCLFSQYTKYELLDIYISWNWGLTERIDENQTFVKDIGLMVASLYSIVSVIDGYGDERNNDIILSLTDFLHNSSEKAKAIDTLITKNVVINNPHDIRCAILTRQMFLNYFFTENIKDYQVNFPELIEYKI